MSCPDTVSSIYSETVCGAHATCRRCGCHWLLLILSLVVFVTAGRIMHLEPGTTGGFEALLCMQSRLDKAAAGERLGNRRLADSSRGKRRTYPTEHVSGLG